jgi:transposase-like protein
MFLGRSGNTGTFMAQHFLLSAAARSLSPTKIMRMSEVEVENVFARLRWPQTDGKPICPKCDCQVCYDCRRAPDRPRWRCKACRADFSVTSGTLFAWHKLPLRTYLMAIAVFCNEVKGKSMLAFCRDLDVQYKTAFVLAHKLREAMAASLKAVRIGGDGRTAEVDGAYFGGHRRPANLTADRIDRRLSENQSGKRQVVVAMRERGARTLAQVLTPWRRSGCASPRAPRCMPMKAPRGTRCTTAFRCNGSTIRMASA